MVKNVRTKKNEAKRKKYRSTAILVVERGKYILPMLRSRLRHFGLFYLAKNNNDISCLFIIHQR